jgi:hypothetical protein
VSPPCDPCSVALQPQQRWAVMVGCLPCRLSAAPHAACPVDAASSVSPHSIFRVKSRADAAAFGDRLAGAALGAAVLAVGPVTCSQQAALFLDAFVRCSGGTQPVSCRREPGHRVRQAVFGARCCGCGRMTIQQVRSRGVCRGVCRGSHKLNKPGAHLPCNHGRRRHSWYAACHAARHGACCPPPGMRQQRAECQQCARAG